MFFCRNQPLSQPQSANQDTDDDDLTSLPRKKLPHLILPLMKNTDNCTFHVWLNILIISSIVVWSNARLICVTWLDCTMAWWVNSSFWHQFARHHHRWKICGCIVFIWQRVRWCKLKQLLEMVTLDSFCVKIRGWAKFCVLAGITGFPFLD